jgi:hypothetical protein
MSQLIGSVQGADLFLIISIIIFLAVAIAVVVYTITLSPETIKKMSQLPLTKNETHENE